MTQEPVRVRVLPRFTIRTFLVLTAAMAVVSLILAAAVRGQLWAQAISIGLLALVVSFLFFTLSFAAIWSVGQLRGQPSEAARSPFGGPGQPPEQVVVPVEPYRQS